MRYFPHTPDDIAALLAEVGVASVDALFDEIPPDVRPAHPPALPGPLDEWTLRRQLEDVAARAGGDWRVFAGAGSQPHAIPAVVPYLAGRGEFLTAYTPYQPEISQGTLQAIFEFQTLVARLAGLAVANASLYDGATALAEAVLMAHRVTRRHGVVVSAALHPHWRAVLDTYLAPHPSLRVLTLPVGTDGRTDFDAFAASGVAAADVAVWVVPSPNFFGVIEDLDAAARRAHDASALLAVGFSEPFAYGLLKSPGARGADIVFGEGQSLGLPQGFGGPGLGLMACRNELVRQLPGRLVGQTVDRDGRRAFVLTLAAREQHIRRGKAVSNICSNAGHCALTAAIFMATAGRDGFRRLAALNRDKAEYLKAGLLRGGFRPLFDGDAPTFNEFALRAPPDFAEKRRALFARKILAGLSLADFFPADPRFENAWLFGATEIKTRDDLDTLIREATA